MTDGRDPHAERLRAVSLRVTKQRAAVLQILERHPHCDAGFLFDAVNEDLGAISRQAVYDVLTALTEAGLVRRIDLVGSAALFELRDSDEHHHTVCRRCGAISDIEDTMTEEQLHAAESRDFHTSEVEVVYWGTCRDCSGHAGEEPDTTIQEDHANVERTNGI
ncbi:hypothetical protein BWI15_01330 [Kribbella sp. ALI-6-A]|uniref:Fur family transcriptional regulator n=1 Tax=Kribbella sp. ALI-6-A TaxID=1933817 RepID=UPI00097BF06E|nr:Fur family transcriptional regulator [Kribbella sp. ALI-6-A]ONI78539.1 hypothetical protein BWI15_01330 [Kribbella sp. ALI-6-A]